MDLVQQVSAKLEIDSSKAEKGVGAETFLQGAPALR